MRLKLKYLLLGSFIGLGLLWGVISTLPDGRLHLIFCDVGQGDAVYIRTPKGSDILIDSGPDKAVLSCLGKHMPFYDRTIELAILTHPHFDHYQGFTTILDRYRIKQFITENVYVADEPFERFRQKVGQSKTPIYNPQAGDKIILDKVEIEVLWPDKVLGDKRMWGVNITNKLSQRLISHRLKISKYSNETQINKYTNITENHNIDKILGESTTGSDLNELSLVLRINYRDFSAILSGDAGIDTLSNISNLNRQGGDLDVLKVPHHGSQTSLSTTLLDQLKPKMAVISVGKNNFGLPNSGILKLLEEKGIEVKRTDKNGGIEIQN